MIICSQQFDVYATCMLTALCLKGFAYKDTCIFANEFIIVCTRLVFVYFVSRFEFGLYVMKFCGEFVATLC